MHSPTSALAGLAERAQKRFPVSVVAKDRFAPVSSIKEMIDRTSELYTGFPGHELRQITLSSALPSSPF